MLPGNNPTQAKRRLEWATQPFWLVQATEWGFVCLCSWFCSLFISQALTGLPERAPNVTCNVYEAGLALYQDNFQETPAGRFRRKPVACRPHPVDSQASKAPTHWVVNGLSTTCWGLYVAS